MQFLLFRNATFLKLKFSKLKIKIFPLLLIFKFKIFLITSFAWILPIIPAAVPIIPSDSQFKISSDGSD